MIAVLRWLFFALVVRTVAVIVLGLNVRHQDSLPSKGPAIVVANHNSHLDTLILMSLFPLRLLPKIHPAAAMDYFLSNRLLAWFALNIIGIIPVSRKPEKPTGAVACRNHKPLHPLQACSDALQRGDILIFFPEGTRGEPEQRAKFKSGLAHLAENHQQTPVVPVFMHGLGKALPKGEALLVPFFCDVFIGQPVYWQGGRAEFMQNVERQIAELEAEGGFSRWE